MVIAISGAGMVGEAGNAGAALGRSRGRRPRQSCLGPPPMEARHRSRARSTAAGQIAGIPRKIRPRQGRPGPRRPGPRPAEKVRCGAM